MGGKGIILLPFLLIFFSISTSSARALGEPSQFKTVILPNGTKTECAVYTKKNPCPPGHEITEECDHKYGPMKCSQCKENLYQCDFTTTEYLVKCHLPLCPENGKETKVKVTYFNNKTCQLSCVCNEANGYTGKSGLECNKHPNTCGIDKELKNGTCVACSPGFHNPSTDYGPCVSFEPTTPSTPSTSSGSPHQGFWHDNKIWILVIISVFLLVMALLAWWCCCCRGDSSHGVSGHQPNGIAGARPNGIPRVSPNGIPGARPNGIPSASPNEIPSASPNGIPGASPNGIPGASPNGIPGASPNGIPGASPNGIPDARPNGIPGARPNGIPDATPNGIPSASPSAHEDAENGPNGSTGSSISGRRTPTGTDDPSIRPLGGQPDSLDSGGDNTDHFLGWDPLTSEATSLNLPREGVPDPEETGRKVPIPAQDIGTGSDVEHNDDKEEAQALLDGPAYGLVELDKDRDMSRVPLVQ
ncbi:uncharacterized protein LOC124144919 isoform X2 [Haliotis rufescens]|uniref:uncharacterized protein LOC124144919 isoform X2 n=1 Tax=Haliotis rufescens TaxID=6454 RepID=UPI00201F5E9D|nr:uncharacterized protein LOC124144919 isoform X2 [Haliotis rufescens]